MRKIGFMLAVALLLAGCTNTGTPKGDEKKSELNPENLVEVKLNVEGMTCEGCEQAIKLGVESLEGVASAESSFEEAWTKVKYDEEKTSIDEIKAKIADTGYKVVDEKEPSTL